MLGIYLHKTKIDFPYIALCVPLNSSLEQLIKLFRKMLEMANIC